MSGGVGEPLATTVIPGGSMSHDDLGPLSNDVCLHQLLSILDDSREA